MNFMTGRSGFRSTARVVCIPSLVLLLSLAGPTPLARAQKSVGGHIGFGFPLVTKDGGNVTTIADNFAMSLPVGITVRGS
jgi:hypothetical protein